MQDMLQILLHKIYKLICYHSQKLIKHLFIMLLKLQQQCSLSLKFFSFFFFLKVKLVVPFKIIQFKILAPSLKWGFKGIRELSTWIVGSRASGWGNNFFF